MNAVVVRWDCRVSSSYHLTPVKVAIALLPSVYWRIVPDID